MNSRMAEACIEAATKYGAKVMIETEQLEADQQKHEKLQAEHRRAKND